MSEDAESEDSKETLPAAESPRTMLRATHSFPLGTGCPLVSAIGVGEAMSYEAVLRAYE